MDKMRCVICAVAVVGLIGCGSTPPAGEGELASAYAIGDRARVGFDEIVVSLPFRGVNTPYQNLHVSLTAFVNPIRKTDGTEWDVQRILRSCEGRIMTRLSERLSEQGEQSLGQTRKLRELIVIEARPIVDEAMKRWEHGSDFKVELAVSSLYWTDASVGRPAAAGRSWWGD
jgi:hypothetical protein